MAQVDVTCATCGNRSIVRSPEKGRTGAEDARAALITSGWLLAPSLQNPKQQSFCSKKCRDNFPSQPPIEDLLS